MHPAAIGRSNELDARRKFYHGDALTLELLDHPDGGRGYLSLAEVANGWHLEQGEQGQPSKLLISESDALAGETINEATAFSIGSKVWKPIEVAYKAPLYLTDRIWSFNVRPTGEPFTG